VQPDQEANKENRLLAALATGAEVSSNGISFVVVPRENGRENRRRSQLLQASQPCAQAFDSQQQPADWTAGSPLKRSEVSIRELEAGRSLANSTE